MLVLRSQLPFCSGSTSTKGSLVSNADVLLPHSDRVSWSH